MAERPGRHLRAGAGAIPRRPAAPVPVGLRPGDDLPARAPGARPAARRAARVAREARRRLGADGRRARQAVPLLEHRRRAVLLRHGHPSRPGDDDARSPRARRLRVLRRGRVSAAERRARARRSRRVLKGAVAGTRGRRGAAARPRAQRRCTAAAATSGPLIHLDNEHSQKYTVLEIVTDDAPGLLLPHQPRRSPIRGATSISC